MFVGDPHGRVTIIKNNINKYQPQSTILLGDMCYSKAIEQLYSGIRNLYWIFGNHDSDRQSWYDSLFKSSWLSQCLHASVQSLSGVRVAGLGGIFRPKIWHPKSGVMYNDLLEWKRGHNGKRFAQLERTNMTSIWPIDYAYLATQKADILVIHEAPSSHKFGFEELDDLAASLGARLIVHGHHHQFYTGVLDNGVAVVGLGLAQIAHMDIEAFCLAKNNKEIFNAFKFTNNKNGGELS